MDIDQELKQKVTNKPTWTRGLYILLFIFIYSIAELVMYAVVIFQFLFSLFTGDRNEQLLVLGRNLSTFIYEVLLYITYNTDDKPYPFGPWPGASAVAQPVAKKKKTAKKKIAEDTAGTDTEEKS
jgi:hypothetical protein